MLTSARITLKRPQRFQWALFKVLGLLVGVDDYGDGRISFYIGMGNHTQRLIAQSYVERSSAPTHIHFAWRQGEPCPNICKDGTANKFSEERNYGVLLISRRVARSFELC